MVIEDYDPEKHFANGEENKKFLQELQKKIDREEIRTYGDLYEELGIPIYKSNDIYYENLPWIKDKEVKMDDKLSPEMMELKDLLEKAQGVSEFWKDKMPMMACEEAGELIQAISKLERNTDSEVESTQRLYKKKLKEEIADMYISLMALQFHYDIRFTDAYEQILRKLDVKYDEKGEKK